MWDISSVRQVTSGAHHYLVAVLSEGTTLMTAGTATVESAARTAVSSARAGPLTAQGSIAVDRLDGLLILRCGYGERLPQDGPDLQVELLWLSA
ncbi:hypothetical protein [Streptomyces sp. NPDC088847]|uniref:hypothetical protein n=1 Tax=Streptomyces sp. NPDC088847 TaxID=3365909 RepID=UPI00381938D8